MATRKTTNTDEILQAIANGDFRVEDQLLRMTEGSYENSGLDPEQFMLVRMAALTAMDASPASWLINLGIGKELGMKMGTAIGTLIAIAPVVGTARVVSAAGNILSAMALVKKAQPVRGGK